jgi:hypothetical protein
LSNYQNLLNLAVAKVILLKRRSNFERMGVPSTWELILINKKMNLESPKVTVEKSAQELFDLLSDVKFREINA